MRIQVSCQLKLVFSQSTPLILMLRPRSGAGQWVSDESYRFVQSVPVSEHEDNYGNLCQRVIAPPNGFDIETTAIVDVPAKMDVGDEDPFVDIARLPEDVLGFLLPSRYCESDRLGARSIEIAEPDNCGYQQVASIVQYIRSHIDYKPGSSDQPQSANEILIQGYGVCKDLAHVCIAMCRSISIPARFVVGYLHGLEPMDLHAWFEAFVGDRWYAFDPTQPDMNGPRVTVGYGRDAADVSIYHQFGPPAEYTAMAVETKIL